MLLLPRLTAGAEAGYYRTPTVHGDRIVFVCEGDLWEVSGQGGLATRLTSQAAAKNFPSFSPDGKQIAFTAGYEGPGNVYVMPAEGGEPKRLTYQPIPDNVAGWAPDGSAVIFRAQRGGLDSEEYLYRVPVAGGQPRKLPLGIAALFSYSPDGKKIAFTRQSWNSHWKHYRGGTAPSIWVGDFSNGPELAIGFARVSRGDRVAMYPMWIGDRIYYVGDSGQAGAGQNIMSMKTDGTDVKMLTHHVDFDVRQPSTDGNHIVYSCGADLWELDPVTGTERKIDIVLPSDRAREIDRFDDADKTLDSFDLSDDGKHVVIASRGQVWVTATKSGSRIVKVADQPGVRNRQVSFSPDGSHVLAINDETGEQELAVFDAKGHEAHKVLTHNKKGWLFPPTWSPDGKTIAYADMTLTLYLADAETGKLTEITKSPNAEITDYSFSPDGKWLAYVVEADNQFQQIELYDVAAAKSYPLSGGFTNDWSPSWDPDGKYLFFLSNRSFTPVADDIETNYSVQNSAKPCLAILTKDGKSPFLPDEVLDNDQDQSQEAAATPATTGPSTTQAASSRPATLPGPRPTSSPATTQSVASQPATTSAATKPTSNSTTEQANPNKAKRDLTETKVDPDGIDQRVVELPVPNDNYDSLSAADGRVFYIIKPPNTIGSFVEGTPAPPQLSLQVFDIKDKKAEQYAGNIDRYAISGDGKRIAIHHDSQIVISDVSTKPADDPDEKVDVNKLPLRVHVAAEWDQIFAEAWRLQRDFYWDANMSGVNWLAVRKKYEPLLPRIGSRGELNDLIAQMQGELGNSHEYIFGGDVGDFRTPTPPPVGVLGADIELDPKTGLFKFVRVYRQEAWQTDIEAPLTASYVHVHDGDFLLAINGHTLSKDDSVDELLADQAEALVQITVASKADKSDSRDVLLSTLSSDEELRYRDWCRRNREYVDRRSGGRLGYFHMRDMEGPGLSSFIQGFYAQTPKDGLVIDERDNRGGWVSQMIIDRLARHIWAYQRPRRGRDFTYPSVVNDGFKCVLIDEFAGSDGDIFPDSFRTQSLGPLIGMRTWGGVIGIRMDKAFIDNGMSSQPEFAFWDPKRGWPLENHGVDPDIQVDKGPADYVADRDPQLDRGIDELLEKLKQHPIVHPKPPPPPDRAAAGRPN
jgi:tricorn protease